MKTFSNNIFKKRKELNYSQEELADKMQVSRQTISNWENGSAYPSLDKAVELAILFDSSIDSLVGKKTETSSKVLKSLVGSTVRINISSLSETFSVTPFSIEKAQIIDVIEDGLTIQYQDKNKTIERTLFYSDILSIERGDL